nr:RNA-directed DNA polymerase, eukaryota [Tanacetum cinerariifolium]
MDGPFILNEIMHWCSSKKKQALIFKVDFEKAYDSVRWDFLDEALQKFGFGNKWRLWIQSCLRSSKSSILVNGSPTTEFQFFKGLKKGDSLSPFLFILIMETLHISFQRMVDVGMFTRIKLNNSLSMLHMFFADDVVFVGKWYESNIDTLTNVLDCFHRASGLKINMSKRKIIGVHVESSKVNQTASTIGCQILRTPFKYLVTEVRGTMHQAIAWQEVIDKELGSVRRQFFNGHDPKSKKASWVKWSTVTSAKDQGGLGVASLYAPNRALMLKWKWRFFANQDSLWTRVVKAIHGEDGNIGKDLHSGRRSCWQTIVNEARVLKNQGIDFFEFLKLKVGDDYTIRFYRWCEACIM